MTNREWLLNKMQNMRDEELGAMLVISQVDKKWCLQDCDGKLCSQCTSEWLKQKYKEPIKLSEAERVILENIDDKYKWIARDKDNDLYMYINKPSKGGISWDSREHTPPLVAFGHLFQFIKWEDDEPYNIEELLK